MLRRATLIPGVSMSASTTTSHDYKNTSSALVPFGYENDCGGFGDVVLDVRARKLTVERNDRFEDYTTSTYEV